MSFDADVRAVTSSRATRRVVPGADRIVAAEEDRLLDEASVGIVTDRRSC